jgi:KipI family sensor histidine kinase inhibitor
MAHRIPRLSEVAIEPLGESALLVRFGARVDPELNRLVQALAAEVRAQAPAWLRDCVPAYASVALCFDPEGFGAQASAPDFEPFDAAACWLRQRIDNMSSTRSAGAGRLVAIEVTYGGEFGPDLAEIAAQLKMSLPELVRRHSQVEYRVAMLGFAPGFPYLLGLDPALATPRLAQPRLKVAAGSVGIGGAQTGIYPREGPGGWRLIGRTEVQLFDPARDPPSLLQPGDRLRFVAREVIG